MAFLQAEVSSAEVVRAFLHDSPYLFLGSAFMGVGLVAAAFTAVRRKLDPLFIYFALFAILYGLRLWVQADLTSFAFASIAFLSALSRCHQLSRPAACFSVLRRSGSVAPQRPHSRIRGGFHRPRARCCYLMLRAAPGS